MYTKTRCMLYTNGTVFDTMKASRFGYLRGPGPQSFLDTEVIMYPSPINLLHVMTYTLNADSCQAEIVVQECISLKQTCIHRTEVAVALSVWSF